jgi:hypothetical protein
MTQVHVVIGRTKTSHSSMADAIGSIRRRLIFCRLDYLFEQEVIQILRQIFLIE